MKDHWIVQWVLRWKAPISSAFVPGSGQLIQHHWAKGAILLTAALIIGGMYNKKSIFMNEFAQGSVTHILIVVSVLVLWAFSIYDAYRASKASPAH